MRMIGKFILHVGGILTLAGSALAAIPGSLDPQFSGDGKLSFVNPSSSTGRGVAVQPDGKIIVISIGANDFTLARLNPDGSFDTTFDGDGKVQTDMAGGNDDPRSVIVQSDGKIVVAGRATNGGGFDVAIARYNSNGSLDTSFDTDGKVFTDFGSTNELAAKIVHQTDGKYLIFGSTGSPSDMIVARYNGNGSLDTSFDGDGKLTLAPGPSNDVLRSGAIQNDGKIVLAGDSVSTTQDFFVARLNADGAFDSTFDSDGKLFVDFAGSADTAGDVRILSDGKLIVGGTSGFDFAVTKINGDGTLDTSFATAGRWKATVGASSSDEMLSVNIQTDGKIVGVGSSTANGTADFCAVRLSATGTPDPGFGSSGFVLTDFDGGADTIPQGALQPDGKLVIVGNAQIQGGGEIGVARYLMRSPNPIADFDGDGLTDISIRRPLAGGPQFWINRSSTGTTVVETFGGFADRFVGGDLTGDGKTDVTIWRSTTGGWFVLRSENSTFYSFPFGASGDAPAPADYDGDGVTDAAVFRPSTGTWYVQRSTGGTLIQGFGSTGDQPVPADYDGDGKSDLAIWRASDGTWWILRSATNQVIAFTFGTSTDRPVRGDYTGDGKTDIAIFRPSNGTWYVLRSEDSSFYSIPFGANGDTPVPGDYDGDGKTDPGVFRPSNQTWYLNRSTAGVLITAFGNSSDAPLPWLSANIN